MLWRELTLLQTFGISHPKTAGYRPYQSSEVGHQQFGLSKLVISYKQLIYFLYIREKKSNAIYLELIVEKESELSNDS